MCEYPRDIIEGCLGLLLSSQFCLELYSWTSHRLLVKINERKLFFTIWEVLENEELVEAVH